MNRVDTSLGIGPDPLLLLAAVVGLLGVKLEHRLASATGQPSDGPVGRGVRVTKCGLRVAQMAGGRPNRAESEVPGSEKSRSFIVYHQPRTLPARARFRGRTGWAFCLACGAP